MFLDVVISNIIVNINIIIITKTSTKVIFRIEIPLIYSQSFGLYPNRMVLISSQFSAPILFNGPTKTKDQRQKNSKKNKPVISDKIGTTY